MWVTLTARNEVGEDTLGAPNRAYVSVGLP
jgi:hypothetical protein